MPPPHKTTSAISTPVEEKNLRPPTFSSPPGGQLPQRHHQKSEVAHPENITKDKEGSGTRSKGRRGGGGFSRSHEVSARDYQAAKKTGVGRGSRITSSTDRAVSECVDLKLTLKQRLDK